MRSLLLLFWSVGMAVAATPVPSPGTGPRLSDAEFFPMLDWARTDLAEVRKAVEKADWPAARHALAEHIRNRPSPKWDIDPRAVGKEPQRRESEADKALAHKFSSIGIEWSFGERIDWTFNPTTQPGSKWARNHEWTWQLNRHSAWLALSRAYYETGDEKYAREFAAELRDWVKACPVSLDKAANVPLSPWRTIEAGIRAGSVWPEVFPRILTAKAFDDETLILMLKSFVDHAQYLVKFPSRGNWLTMEANGLYHVGALFPEFKEAKLWRDTAAGWLYRELDDQVYPDGSQIELAPGYHGVTIRNFLGPVRLTSLTGFELPKEYLPKMEKMFDYFLYSMQPDRRTPALNDSGAGSVVGYLREGAEFFPQREDFRWVASDGKEGKPPPLKAREFPYAGQFIMRSGWDRDALWLCMDGGPFGFGHQHEDKLSVCLTAFGAPLLVEGGVYTYDASQWRSYVLSSRAHNVVLVDGLEQNRRKEPRETYVVKTPLPHIWESSDSFDHAAARFDEGWGPKALRVAKHTRHVFFLKPDLFVIADEMEPLDTKPHTYEALFHFDAADAKVDGLQVTTEGSSPNLNVTAHGPEGVTLIKGQKEPVVQGWLPDSSGGYGGIRPIPTAVYRKTATGKTVMLYVLYPTPGNGASPVAETTLSGNVLSVRLKNGSTKTARFQPF